MKDCCLLALSKETTSLYETDGFRNTDLQRNYYYYLQLKKEEEVKNSLYWCEALISSDSLEYVWLWDTIEPESKRILGFSISKEQNMLIAEKYLSKNTEISMANIRGINIDGGTCWYPPQAHQFLKLQHHTSMFPIWEKHHYWKDYAAHKG